MATYNVPGVYIAESQLASLIQAPSGPTAAVFLGESPRGPQGPTLITDWQSYKTLFGDLDNAYDMCYSVYHYFANGGRSAYIIRIYNSSATSASTSPSTGASSITVYTGSSVGGSVSLATFSANSPGTWGNSLKLTTSTGLVTSSSVAKPTFNLSVALNNVEVESWKELSMDENANRFFPEMLNRYSKFITASSISTITSSSVAAASTLGTFTSASASLSGGASGGSVGDTAYNGASGIDLIDSIPGNLLLNAVGKGTTVVQYLATKAASRGDSFVIADPNGTDASYSSLKTTATGASGVTGGNFVAQYTPMLEMVDPLKTGPGALRTTFPGGAVAGVYVRTELARSVAKAPAGYDSTIVGALGLTIKLSDAQVGELYDLTPPCNTFKAVPGAGVFINGTRTLEKVNPDKFIPVRRSLNYIRKSIKEIVQPSVFEPNDANLWIEVNNGISNFLLNFWRAGGLKGAKSTDAFFVVCDSTNNNATSIDQGIVNVSVGVALVYPAEFIVINLSQWTGGSNAAEINV